MGTIVLVAQASQHAACSPLGRDGQRAARVGASQPRIMRRLVAILVAWTLGTTLGSAREAWADGASRTATDQADAALSARPPQRDVARAAIRTALAANDDAEAVAQADFLLGQLDEEDGAYPQALLDDRAAVDAAPTSRWAFRASDRIDWLRARAEGNFEPLRTLERLRRDPALSNDPAAIEGLARQADGFPPGMVRVEARMVVAEAWLGRLERPDDGIAILRLVTAETHIDPLTQRLAERELVEAMLSRGDIDGAVAEVAARPARFDSRFAKQVRRLKVRRAVGRGAVAVLAIFGVLALLALVRAWRAKTLHLAWEAMRALAPTAGLFVALIAGGGGALASKYETGNAAPFFMLGAAVLPLLLVARAWSAVGAQRPAARAARALLSAATVVSAAFVMLELVNPEYLVGFGL